MKTVWSAVLGAIVLAAGCNPGGEDTAAPELDEATLDGDGVADPEARADTSAEAFELTDYDDMANWLCHPGKGGSLCDTDLSYTVVNADGTTTRESFKEADNPPIDCFYIYPTVSMDPGTNSDLVPGDEERRVVASQFAHFGSACRLFAPVYRQITLTQLQKAMSGGSFEGNFAMRYSDVQRAWENYLETGNDGRGVVLIGHSQGASMLLDLLANDIIGSEAEDRVISAMPIGMTTYVDAETGNYGPFEPCTSREQIGCILSYVSFRADVPPPESSRFGITGPDGRRALCVNPAELSGDNGVLDARLPATGYFGRRNTFANDAPVDTPFAALPGLLTAECVEGDNHDWLAITVHGDPDDPRTDDITGDVILADGPSADWGLHLIDMSAAMGNLVEIVQAQGEIYTAAEAAGEAEAVQE